MTMFDPATPDDLDARLDLLPNDIGITVRVGALRNVLATLRGESEDAIAAWMSAVATDDEFGLTMDPCEHPSVNGTVCAACSLCVKCGGTVSGPSCPACALGLAP